MIQIFVPGLPRPQGSKIPFVMKNGKAGMMESCKGLKDWRSLVAIKASEAFTEPVRNPCRLDITFLFPRPQGHFNSKGALRDKFTYPMKMGKPDLDKILRSVQDAMSKIVYFDDSQIVEVKMRKVYSGSTTPPGALIQISFDEKM